MAATAITAITVSSYNTFTTAATYSSMLSALDGTDGGLITWPGKDEKCLLIAENSDASTAKTITVKAGNGFAGNKDIAIELAAGKYTLAVLESAAFKNISGDNKGKVKLTGAAAIKVALVRLP